MKKTLVVALVSAFAAAPAQALEWGMETFINYKANQTEGSKHLSGIDVDRLRVFAKHKFDDTWSFNGRFETKADGGNKIYIKEAHFAGSNLWMDGDVFKFGAQNNPAFTMENAFGNRWITKPLGDDEKFLVDAWQSGASYKMGLGMANVTLFSLSGESADAVDNNDDTQLNGAMVDFKAGDATTIWLQNATINTGLLGATAAGTSVMSAGVNYVADAMKLGFAYHSASYTVASGTAPKANTAMGLNGTFNKLIGSANLYFHYWTGFDKYADTGEETESKMKIGPTWSVAEKLNLGVFYETEAYQAEYKTANATAKDPSALWIQMAARF